jgi:hypothetical protein
LKKKDQNLRPAFIQLPHEVATTTKLQLARLTSDMDSASKPKVKSQMASESATHASANKPYHLTILDPATTTVEDVYKELE